jgi:hypothetical protein
MVMQNVLDFPLIPDAVALVLTQSPFNLIRVIKIDGALTSKFAKIGKSAVTPDQSQVDFSHVLAGFLLVQSDVVRRGTAGGW